MFIDVYMCAHAYGFTLGCATASLAVRVMSEYSMRHGSWLVGFKMVTTTEMYIPPARDSVLY